MVSVYFPPSGQLTDRRLTSLLHIQTTTVWPMSIITITFASYWATMILARSPLLSWKKNGSWKVKDLFFFYFVKIFKKGNGAVLSLLSWTELVWLMNAAERMIFNDIQRQIWQPLKSRYTWISYQWIRFEHFCARASSGNLERSEVKKRERGGWRGILARYWRQHCNRWNPYYGCIGRSINANVCL